MAGHPERPVLVDPADIVEAATLVAADLAARADGHDRQGTFAPENIEALWAAGLGNLTLPREFGGSGADLATVISAVERVAAGDASTALIWVMHLLQLRGVGHPDGGWPEGLRRRVITESLAGPALINALRVEPELGTPARGGIPATVARPIVGAAGSPAWSLSGHKMYTTGSTGLRFMSVWAVTAPGAGDEAQVGYFVVPTDRPGIEIVPTWDHLGMRASASHDVIFHDVEIPLDHTLGLIPAGSADAPRSPETAAWMIGLIAAVYNGVATAARDWLVGYLNDRVPSNLGASLATLPRFQSTVGGIQALLHVNRTLLDDLGQATAAGQADAATAGLVKVVVTRNAITSIEQGLALIGNPGLTYHHPLQRHYRDALCSRIHTPQDDTVLLALGRAALDLSS